MESESQEQMQTRHRRELKDLQGRITGKKKNATKKTRKGVNDECAEMERQLRETQAVELAGLGGESHADDGLEDENLPTEHHQPNAGLQKMGERVEEKLAKAAEKLHISNDTASAQLGKKRNR